MKKTLTSLLLLVLAGIANAQLTSWQFGIPATNGDEASVPATYTNPHLTSAPLSRGAGLVASGFVRGFSAVDFTLSGTKADAIANGDYYQTSFTVQAGYTASVYNIDAHLRRSSTAAANAYRWMYSLDGTNFTDIGTADVAFTTSTADGDDQTSITASSTPALQNLPANTTVTLRLYLWGATTATSAISFGRFAADNTAPSLSIGGRVTPVNASSLVAWQFGNPASAGNEVTYASTSNNANMLASTLSRGAGIPAVTATALGRGFTAANFMPLNSVKSDAVTNGNYYQFIVKAANGYTMSLSTLDARLRRSGAGANAYRWAYSLDGTNFTELGTSDVSFMSAYDGVDQPQIDLSSVTALQNVPAATTITFRIYAWGATTATGTFAIGRYITGVANNSLEVQGRADAVTPLTLFDFKAEKARDNIALSWRTAQEINVDRFVVERSGTAQDFKQVAYVTASNTAGQHGYSFADVLNSTTVYYRLKMIDRDGSYSYSKVVAVKAGTAQAMNIYPNPVKDACTVEHPLTEANASLLITDMSGKIVAKQAIANRQRTTSINIAGLVKGNYSITVINNQKKYTVTLQKL